MITLVTTTRNRSLSFSLLEHWISRQTVQPNQWLVINDGTDPYSYNHKQQVVLRDPGKDVLPSICENWLAALPLIRGDVVVAEDDDWLHPEYLATMRELLEAADLVGFTDDRYYRVPTRRFSFMGNGGHASLGATAFRQCVLPQVERCCRVFKSVWIDMYLWAEWTAGRSYYLRRNQAKDGRAYHVGFKGMPGAKGLGMGHNLHEGQADEEGRTLAEWIGSEDASLVYGTVRNLTTREALY